MRPTLKATLWILTLLTGIYVSQQYRIAQQARASAQTQHTTISSTPTEAYKVTQIGGQLMRINETNLVSAISEDERKARKTVIQMWYNAIDPALKENVPYEAWEAAWAETPAWLIQESFEKWKRKQAEEKQRAEQERRKLLIQSWHKQLTPQEQAATPYEQFETTLLAVTDLAARQKVIRSWYDLMDDTYKQKVPFERFQAIEIQQSLASLQTAIAEQQKATSTPAFPARIKSRKVGK